MREKVEQLLESIRSRLRMDGCDLVLEDVTADGRVKLRFVGTSACCPMSRIALLAGIEGVLKAELPGFRGVESV